ncbi:MAG: hypothetical protein KIT72_14970 [Polyangiaceae bacterium]|nr:hypothetical protein [Polyangiaceae bacterium]MCW5791718.1 hypothetical protein [Polyangiaceae bacterium]
MRISSARASTAIAAAGLLVALLACKKDEEAPPPEPAPVATPEPEPEVDAAAPAKKDDEVTRYGDKESPESGTVRVLAHNLRVYTEADTSGTSIATLNRGTLVNLKARYGNFLLIEYPSGVKQLSPGWIQATINSPQLKKEDVKPEEVTEQDAGVTPTPTATASAEPTATATAEPSAAPTATGDAGRPLRRLPGLKLPTKTE